MGKMTKKLARENKKGTKNRVEKSVKKITIIKKQTCITTNRIRTLQICIVFLIDERRNLFRENDRNTKGWRIRNQIINKEKQKEKKQDKKRAI